MRNAPVDALQYHKGIISVRDRGGVIVVGFMVIKHAALYYDCAQPHRQMGGILKAVQSRKRALEQVEWRSLDTMKRGLVKVTLDLKRGDTEKNEKDDVRN